MAFKFACYFNDPAGYRFHEVGFTSRPFFFHPSDRSLIAEAAGLKSPPQLSELPCATIRGYRFRTKKNDNNMVLVEDYPEGGGLGDGVASGYVYYFKSFQEEWNFVLLMGKNFDLGGCNVEFMDGHQEQGKACVYLGYEEEEPGACTDDYLLPIDIR